MDTQSGQYGDQGGWHWDGTKWVPVSPHSSDSGAQTHAAAPQGTADTPAPPFGGHPQPGQPQPQPGQVAPGHAHAGPPQAPSGQPQDEATLPGVQPSGYPPQLPAGPQGDQPYPPQLPAGPQGGQVQPPGDPQDPGQQPQQASAFPGPAPDQPQSSPQSSPPATSAPPFSTPPASSPVFSAPPSSSAPPAYGQPRPPMPLPPGFGPEGSPDPAPVPPATPVSSAPPGPAHISAPPGPSHVSAPPGATSPGPTSPGPTSPAPAAVQPGGYQPQEAAAAYQGSGLTAADLTWSEPAPRKGGAWKVVGAVVGVLVLLAGAAVGGWFFRDLRGGPAPEATASPVVADANRIQQSLTGDGFECGAAYTEPVPIDLCFRDVDDYRDTVGFQMLDSERIGWLKLRVDSAKPAKSPVKERALKLFRTVLDQALIARDAKSVNDWLAANLPEDYEKNQYLTHETGGVRLQLLPRHKQSALLWVRLTAASYQPAGEKSVPKATAGGMEKYYKGEGYTCRPSQGGVNCEKKAGAETTTVTYGVVEGKISAVRLTVSPSGKVQEAAPTAKQAALALIGQILADERLAEAKKWLQGAFDGKPHHAVLSGLEVRVAPVEIPAEARSFYEVDVRPADW